MAKRIVIVGAGLVGLASAWALLQRGYAVTLIDRSASGRESSWAGAGILSPLLPWDYPAAVSDICLAAMRAYPDWVAGIAAASGKDPEYWMCGMTILGVQATPTITAWCTAHGMALAAHDDGLRLPGVAQVRNPRLADALRTAILNSGGMLVECCEVLRIETDGLRVQTLVTSAGEMVCDELVIATGAWSGLALPGMSAVPGVKPMRGQMVLFELPPGVLDSVLYHDGFYLVPRRDGHILAGSTVEDAGFDKSTDAETAARLQARAWELLPALADHAPVRHWAGLRPGSPDNIPVMDRHPEFANVYVNAGHFRYGVTMAPAAAEHVADLIEGRTPALDPAPYRWAAITERLAASERA